MIKKFYFLTIVSVLFFVILPTKDAYASTESKLLDVSREYLGVPYSFGGSTPSGFDCSGYTQYVFNQLGISLPRTTLTQYNVGTSVSRSDLQVGDLVFFNNTYRAGISHVGIYVGNNEFISATSSRGIAVVSLSSSYWGPRYAGAKRVADFTNESESSLFNDIPANSPSYDAVKALTSQEVIFGYSDGSFRPDNSITRHQAAAILNRYLGYETTKDAGFSDMGPNDLFYEDVAAMKEAGILNGFSDGTFRPQKLMSRTEMAIIIKRAFDLEDYRVSAEDAIYNDVSKDSNFYETVQLMNAIDQTGAFSDSQFNGHHNASRLDFTTAVYNGIHASK